MRKNTKVYVIVGGWNSDSYDKVYGVTLSGNEAYVIVEKLREKNTDGRRWWVELSKIVG